MSMRNIWRRDESRTLISNFFSLSVLQIANRLFPLITLPYLLRVLGPDRYGLIVFAQSVIVYFQLVTNFGFDLSATKEIAATDENHHRVSLIFSSVLLAKGLLLVGAFVVLGLLLLSFDRLFQDWNIFLLTFLTLTGQSLYPTWLFHGLQKMKYATIVHVIARSLFTVLVFILVDSPDDYLLVPGITALGNLIAGLTGLAIACFSFRVTFVTVQFRDVAERLKNGSVFFLSMISRGLYSSTSAVILAVFLNNEAVAFYAAADKIYNALVMIVQPVSRSIYPYMVKSRNLPFFKKVFISAVSLNILLWAAVAMLSGVIIQIIFGPQYADSRIVLQILAIGGLVNVPSILLGIPLLAALGHARWVTYSVVTGTFFHLTLLTICIPILSYQVVAGIVVFSHLWTLFFRVVVARKLVCTGNP